MNKIKKNNTILVCGSLAYDRIMDFPGYFRDHIMPEKVHILNLSFTVNDVKQGFGGTAGNIAYNLSLLGERPTILGVGGEDFGKYLAWLKQNNIDVAQIKIDKSCLTAGAYIMTDRADNQIAGFYPGSKTPQTPLIRGAKIAIVAPDYIARMLKYVKIFKQKKVPYIFDPGQQIISLKDKDLKSAINGAKVLIGNDYEIELILKRLGLNLEKLAKLVEILVVTKGGSGSEIYNQGKILKIPPAKPKNLSDPTGAGDAYRAGLIKGMLMHWPLEKCGRLAGLVAVYTVEKYGTQTHRFTWKELEKRYKFNFGEKL